jgi:uncharacterized protein YdeI (YjbR/CyaY-like superfamily)
MKVTPKSRQAWRDWLAANHAAKTEVWLVFYKRDAGKPTLSYNDAVEEALCFGWIDGVKRSIDGERYMHRFSPRKPDSKWSASNRARAERMEQAGLMTAAGGAAVRSAKRSGKWNAPDPSVDLSMPPEFGARLRRDAAAAEFFASLAPSYQRQFVGWIATAKRPETKQRRLEETIALLRRGEKLGMR